METIKHGNGNQRLDTSLHFSELLVLQTDVCPLMVVVYTHVYTRLPKTEDNERVSYHRVCWVTCTPVRTSSYTLKQEKTRDTTE